MIIMLFWETDEVMKESEVNLFGLGFADFFLGTDFYFQMQTLVFVLCTLFCNSSEIRIRESGCFQ